MAERIFDNFKKMNNDLYKESLERMGIGLEEEKEVEEQEEINEEESLEEEQEDAWKQFDKMRKELGDKQVLDYVMASWDHNRAMEELKNVLRAYKSHKMQMKPGYSRGMPEQKLQEMKLPNYNEFEFEYQKIMGKGNKK